MPTWRAALARRRPSGRKRWVGEFERRWRWWAPWVSARILPAPAVAGVLPRRPALLAGHPKLQGRCRRAPLSLGSAAFRSPAARCRALAGWRSRRSGSNARRAVGSHRRRHRLRERPTNRYCSIAQALQVEASRNTDTQRTRRSQRPNRTASRSKPTSPVATRGSAESARSAEGRTAQTVAAATRRTASTGAPRARRARAARLLQRGPAAPTYEQRGGPR